MAETLHLLFVLALIAAVFILAMWGSWHRDAHHALYRANRELYAAYLRATENKEDNE